MQELNSLRQQKYKPSIQQTTTDKNSKAKSAAKAQHDTNSLQEEQKLKLDESVSKKRKKKSQNVNKKQKEGSLVPLLGLDEVKLFEKKLENDFESSKHQEKIQVHWPDEWLTKLKNKLLMTVKGLRNTNAY